MHSLLNYSSVSFNPLSTPSQPPLPPSLCRFKLPFHSIRYRICHSQPPPLLLIFQLDPSLFASRSSHFIFKCLLHLNIQINLKEIFSGLVMIIPVHFSSFVQTGQSSKHKQMKGQVVSLFNDSKEAGDTFAIGKCNTSTYFCS